MSAVRDLSILVEHAYDDPVATLREVASLLSDPSLPERDRCRADWAAGLAHRELGDMVQSVSSLESALERARGLDERRLAGRIATTLAWAFAQSGRPVEGLDLLDAVEPDIHGVDLGHLRLQRGLVLFVCEQISESIRNLGAAREIFEEHGDELALARTHLNLGVVLGSDDQHQLALRHAERASALSAHLGQQLLTAQARHNVGYAASRLGDVPRALAEMGAAESALESLDHTETFRSTVLMDRARVLLDANLVVDACEEADRSLRLAAVGDNAVLTGECSLLAARCHVRTGNLELGSDLANRASQLFEQAGRGSWRVLADFTLLEAQSRLDPVELDANAAESLALRLINARWSNEAIAASLLAAEALVNAGEPDRARAVLDRMRRRPMGPTAVERAGGALVRAAFHVLNSDDASARRAITVGLRLLADNQTTVATLELRAFGSAHGRALADLGMSLARRDRRPRELLRRSEQGRGAVARLPPARPIDADQLLIEYRATTHRRSSDTTLSDEDRRIADAALSELEGRLRRRSRRDRRPGDSVVNDPDAVVRVLGARELVDFVRVDGELVVLHVARGRVRLVRSSSFDVGPYLDQLSMALGRLQRSGASEPSRAASRLVLEHVGEEMQEALMPPRVVSGASPLVIVPTGALHAMPWSILPCIRGRAVSIAPSLAGWSIAAFSRRPGRILGLVSGPALDHSRDEVTAIRTVVEPNRPVSEASTVAQTIDVLEAVDVVHFACHGRFRADSPLFSSLRLADGELTFYDLEHCSRLPHTVVMSACDAAQHEVLDGDALLGMASALIQLGVSSVIAPLTPVNDERSVDLMVRLHTHLAAGVEPAEALALASIGPAGDLDPTAAPFICFGS